MGTGSILYILKSLIVAIFTLMTFTFLGFVAIVESLNKLLASANEVVRMKTTECQLIISGKYKNTHFPIKIHFCSIFLP